MKPVVLVGCAATKLQRPALARDLYTSVLFRQGREWAERNGRRWFILSALHGLIEPDAELAPYDLHMAQLTRDQRAGWASTVVDDLRTHGLPDERLTVLAGELYTVPLGDAGVRLDLPLAGLSVGRRLAWFKRELAKVPCEWCGGEVIEGAGPCPLSFECPTCHVPPREWCKRPSEHRAPELHSARRRLEFAAVPA